MKRNYKGDPPNPLFEKWLTEMKEQAAANDSPIQHSFGKALSSLRKCPIRLETGKDCLVLQHFGKKICDILDKKLEEYKKANNLPSTSRASTLYDILGDKDENVGGKKAKKSESNDRAPDGAGPNNERPVFKAPRNKPYIPKVGSGAYAILTTMYSNMQKPDYPGYMLKKDIISQAQKTCDSPMKGNAIEHYSGWSSMSTLISKHYVIKKSNPAKYSLTDSGVALALSLIEGRAMHHRDSDNEDKDDDIAIASTSASASASASASSKKNPANSKGKKKPKSKSSVSSESDSAKASTSGIGLLENRFSDSDDEDVFKNLNNLKPTSMKAKECQSTSRNSDDELEAALAISLTETKATKTRDNLTSENESKTDVVFEDDLKMALALSITETIADNNKASNDDVDEDEEFKRALAMSLNESKVKNDVNLDVHDAEHFFEDEKLKTNGIIEQYSDTEMDEDLKAVLALSAEEAKLKESFFKESFDHTPDGEKPSVSNIANTKQCEALSGSFSKNVKQDEIICLDDDDDDEFESKVVDGNKDDDESYMEFCKENAEPILPVKKKSKHFIFTDAPASDNDLNLENDANLIKENYDANADLNSTPKKFDGQTNNHQSNEKQNLSTKDRGLYNDDFRSAAENIQTIPKKMIPIDNSKKRESADGIIISDDDENVQSEIPARADIFTSSPVKNLKTPTKISKPTKESSQSPVNFQRDELQKFIDLPSTSKNSNVNPPSRKPTRKVKEKGNSQTNGKTQETPEDEPYESLILLPNNFDIVLLVDIQETSGTKKKSTDDATISGLTDAGVLFQVRSLKVGDFAWIARCRFTQKELILPYIVERKRIDDLSCSITDGRYHEQKHRLRQSGINNVIYLIEHFGKTYHGALPLTSLFQAGINTTVQDGFITKFTKDHKDSIFYLAALTRKLIRMYKSKELVSCPKKHLGSGSQVSEDTERLMEFSEFNKAALKTKQFTVREMLIKQLVQLKGVSAEKAIGIAELYPTPQILAEALRKGDKNLLADIEAGSSRRKIGPTISNVLHMFYTKVNLN